MQAQRPDLDRIARKRARAKLGFFIHLAVFAVVNAGLMAINGHLTPGHAWFLWPLGGWGIGLSLHGLAVFFLGAGSGVLERMVAAERRRLEQDLGHTR